VDAVTLLRRAHVRVFELSGLATSSWSRGQGVPNRS
jgi:hypothetical protein